MQRGIFAAGAMGILGFFLAGGSVRAEDLVTLSGTTYRDVRAVRVEPDGVTWRYVGGVVKVDFADCPEGVRRAYHYDAEKATAYQDVQARARQQADAQAHRDAREHEARQRAHMQAVVAQTTATDPSVALTIRRALSPAASNSIRATAAHMQADADQRAADAADPLKLVPPLPDALGPRPINPFMDTPGAKEFAASLHRSPTGATSNFVPEAVDLTRSSINDNFYQPLYMTRSYYEDIDRAAAFARDAPSR